jgi:[ribosomal protein S5]-alanine N-acetyltransferase
MTAAAERLDTPRLRLQAPSAGLAPALLSFHRRNAAHLAPWDPPVPTGFLTLETQALRIEQARLAFERGEALRWWLQPADDPLRIIGVVGLSQIARGAFHSAVLGYAIDASCQGQGLMSEALQAVLAEAFGERVALHRVQAAVRPENLRSVAVLSRLGFESIGLARDYLFIDGAWRDHGLWQRLSPAFRVPLDWRQASDSRR